MRSFFMFLFISFVCTSSYAQDITRLTSVPHKLYHWMSLKHLDSTLDDFENKTNFLRPINPTYGIAMAYPEFRNVPGRFTWIDPMTGIAGSSSEIYGDGEVLMEIELNPGLKKAYKVQALQGEAPGVDKRKVDEALKADIVFFEMYFLRSNGDTELFFQEWIILNPNIIRKIEVNPRLMTPLLRTRLSRLDIKNANGEQRRYPINLIHNPKSDLPNSNPEFLKDLIEKYIKVHSPNIQKILTDRARLRRAG